MFPTTRVSKVLPLLFKFLSKSPIRIRVLSSRVPGFDTSAVESPRINKSTRSSDGFQQHQNSRGELCGEHQPNQDTNRRCGPCLWWRLSQQDRQSAVSFRPAFEHSWSSRRMQWLWSHPSIRSFFSPRIWSFHTSGLFTPRSLSQNCLRCLEKVKTYSPEWWFNNDLPWWKKQVKHHLKQTQVTVQIWKIPFGLKVGPRKKDSKEHPTKHSAWNPTQNIDNYVVVEPAHLKHMRVKLDHFPGVKIKKTCETTWKSCQKVGRKEVRAPTYFVDVDFYQDFYQLTKLNCK